MNRIPPGLSRRYTKIPKHWKDKSDPQAERIYLAERQFYGTSVGAEVPLRILRAISVFICRQYGIKPPVIESYEKQHALYGFQLGSVISLNRNPKYNGVNTSVLVHELSHYVADSIYQDTEYDCIEGHGPEFAAIYGWIMDRLNILPFYCWEEICKKYGIILANDGSPEAVKHGKKRQ